MDEKLVAYPTQEMTTNIWNKRLGHFIIGHSGTYQRNIWFENYNLWGMNTQLAAHVNWENKVGCLLPRQPGEHQ